MSQWPRRRRASELEKKEQLQVASQRLSPRPRRRRTSELEKKEQLQAASQRRGPWPRCPTRSLGTNHGEQRRHTQDGRKRTSPRKNRRGSAYGNQPHGRPYVARSVYNRQTGVAPMEWRRLAQLHQLYGTQRLCQTHGSKTRLEGKPGRFRREASRTQLWGNGQGRVKNRLGQDSASEMRVTPRMCHTFGAHHTHARHSAPYAHRRHRRLQHERTYSVTLTRIHAHTHTHTKGRHQGRLQRRWRRPPVRYALRYAVYIFLGFSQAVPSRFKAL